MEQSKWLLDARIQGQQVFPRLAYHAQQVTQKTPANPVPTPVISALCISQPPLFHRKATTIVAFAQETWGWRQRPKALQPCRPAVAEMRCRKVPSGPLDLCLARQETLSPPAL